MAVHYADNLVELTDEALLIKHYYFPFGGPRIIRLSDIEAITAKEPSLQNGQWRLWGTTTFQIWFARDLNRAQRPVIYHVEIRGQVMKVGFTVEDAARFSDVLAQTGLLWQEY